MSGKAILCCVGLKPVCRGSLRGFASILFVDPRMRTHGIGRITASTAGWV
jgi:hypothetical protein